MINIRCSLLKTINPWYDSQTPVQNRGDNVLSVSLSATVIHTPSLTLSQRTFSLCIHPYVKVAINIIYLNNESDGAEQIQSNKENIFTWDLIIHYQAY